MRKEFSPLSCWDHVVYDFWTESFIFSNWIRFIENTVVLVGMEAGTCEAVSNIYTTIAVVHTSTSHNCTRKGNIRGTCRDKGAIVVPFRISWHETIVCWLYTINCYTIFDVLRIFDFKTIPYPRAVVEIISGDLSIWVTVKRRRVCMCSSLVIDSKTFVCLFTQTEKFLNIAPVLLFRNLFI